jgi:hypothetical protein
MWEVDRSNELEFFFEKAAQKSYILKDVVRLSIHPSKFFIPEEEEDERGGGGGRMAAAIATTVAKHPILSNLVVEPEIPHHVWCSCSSGILP